VGEAVYEIVFSWLNMGPMSGCSEHDDELSIIIIIIIIIISGTTALMGASHR
jgi:hypothetical protein